jgi:ABC-type methionine transport system ATPase subunit
MLKLLGIEGRLFLPIRPIQGGDTLPYTITVGERLYFPFSANMNEQNTLKLSHRLDWDAWPVVLGDDLQPRALSSGEHALLRLSAQMAASVETGSLLLLDEPETHLHPNYISVLMSVVHSLLDKTNSAAIIATHSAYIVREVGKTKVNVLSVENRIPDCGRPLMQTFGASIDSISQFVFGDSDQTHRFQQSLEKWLAGGAADRGIDALVQEYAGHLNSEVLSLIARLIREPNDGA